MTSTFTFMEVEGDRLVVLPNEQMLAILRLARISDSIVFWHFDRTGAPQPVMFPRERIYGEATEMALQ